MAQEVTATIEGPVPRGAPLRVTVGICAHNEENNIATALQSILKAQGANCEISEVIVVASGCTDRTEEIVRELASKDGRVMLISEPFRKGKASGISAVLARSSGGVAVLIPADVELAPRSISRLVGVLEGDERCGVVCGSPVPRNNGGWFTSGVCELLWGLHNATLSKLNHHGRCSHATGELMAMKRGVVNSVPNGVINEDAYIALYASMNGYTVRFVEHAPVKIRVPGNPVDLIRQRRRVVFGHRQLKKLLGNYPSSLSLVFVKSPWLGLRIVVKALARRSRNMAFLFPLIIIEAVSRILALADEVSSRDSVHLWEPIRTTKDSMATGTVEQGPL